MNFDGKLDGCRYLHNRNRTLRDRKAGIQSKVTLSHGKSQSVLNVFAWD
jgi:hypothetical protein